MSGDDVSRNKVSECTPLIANRSLLPPGLKEDQSSDSVVIEITVADLLAQIRWRKHRKEVGKKYGDFFDKYEAIRFDVSIHEIWTSIGGDWPQRYHDNPCSTLRCWLEVYADDENYLSWPISRLNDLIELKLND